jgi:hypothetical protein
MGGPTFTDGGCSSALCMIGPFVSLALRSQQPLSQPLRSLKAALRNRLGEPRSTRRSCSLPSLARTQIAIARASGFACLPRASRRPARPNKVLRLVIRHIHRLGRATQSATAPMIGIPATCAMRDWGHWRTIEPAQYRRRANTHAAGGCTLRHATRDHRLGLLNHGGTLLRGSPDCHAPIPDGPYAARTMTPVAMIAAQRYARSPVLGFFLTWPFILPRLYRTGRPNMSVTSSCT